MGSKEYGLFLKAVRNNEGQWRTAQELARETSLDAGAVANYARRAGLQKRPHRVDRVCGYIKVSEYFCETHE